MRDIFTGFFLEHFIHNKGLRVSFDLFERASSFCIAVILREIVFTSAYVLFINLAKELNHAFACYMPAFSLKLIRLDNKPKVDTVTTTSTTICKTLPK